MTALRTVTEITTADLTLGDTVIYRTAGVQVVELIDTGRPAMFGTGNAWDVTLQDQEGRRTELTAATSQRWTRA